MEDEDYGPCPGCGGKVNTYPECPTYQSRGVWMVCMPCGNALSFFCAGDVTAEEDEQDDEGCGWEYIWGANKNNPRFANNESFRPDWLEGEY